MNREPALLAGLVRCGSCGHVMTRGAGAREHTAYACPRDHSGGRCPAPAAITVALLDAHVAAIARSELARLSVTSSGGKGVKRARAALADAEREMTAYLGAVRAAGVGQDVFAAGARQRKEAVDAARDELDAELGVHAIAPTIAGGAEAWDTLNGHERNGLLRALLSAVIVERVGRGVRVPVADRVRVLAYGADVRLPEGRRGEASGIVPVPLPDLDHPGVLRVPSGEDALKGASSVDKMRAVAA